MNAAEYLEDLRKRYEGHGWITLQWHERRGLGLLLATLGEQWEVSTMQALIAGKPVETNAFITAMNMNIASARSQLARAVTRRLRS
jgi:hypothetical protein